MQMVLFGVCVDFCVGYVGGGDLCGVCGGVGFCVGVIGFCLGCV